ncbi:aa3-type cytochrome oxidase subunit II [Microlunatus flavus]|nr:cytochrome c oxidase subunit II [Microlunatus flavus]
MALCGVALTLLAGCSAETTGQLKRLGLPVAATEQAPAIGNLWIGTWIAAGSIGIAVWGLIGWAALRYKSDHNEMPRQNRYNLPMEIFYTVAPFVVIGVLFYYTILAQDVVQKNPDPDLTVDVVGQKWSWTFNYESADVPGVGTDVYESGTINVAPTLYLPVNKTVRFNLSSPDVNHSFWVPSFYEKMDVIPGRDNHFTVTPNREGVYAGKCAELCGTYHFAMRFEVHVVSEQEYAAHLKTLVDRGQTGTAKGAAIPNPVGEPGNTGNPDAPAVVQGGTR